MGSCPQRDSFTQWSCLISVGVIKCKGCVRSCQETIPGRIKMNVGTRVQDFTGLVREFVDYLRERKTYWLTPLIFVLLMLATLGFFLEGSVVAPAIYSIF